MCDLECLQHPCCYATCQCCRGTGDDSGCYGFTFFPCCLVAGVPTKANQLKWSGPGWYVEGMHAISRGDDAALRRIVAGPGWKPDNANQKFKVDKHTQVILLFGVRILAPPPLTPFF